MGIYRIDSFWIHWISSPACLRLDKGLNPFNSLTVYLSMKDLNSLLSGFSRGELLRVAVKTKLVKAVKEEVDSLSNDELEALLSN